MMGKRPKILAISSGGGHWIQLLRLRPAFEGCEVVYATASDGYSVDLDGKTDFRVITDSNSGRSPQRHQLATARKLSEMKLVRVAFDENDLRGMLDHIEEITPSEPISPYANPELILALPDFIYSRESP